MKGDTKAVVFLHKANLVGSCRVANFTTAMVTMTVHVMSSLPKLIVIKGNTCKCT